MVRYGGTSPFLGAVGLVALSILLSLFSGAAGMAIRLTPASRMGHLILACSVWVSRDFFVERVFSGFPWCSLGYSQHRNLWGAQWAELGGIHLLTFVVFLINGWLYLFLAKREKRRLVALLGFVALFELGGWLLQARAERAFQRDPIHRAGIVQPNVNHDMRFNYYSSRDKLQRLFSESARLKTLGCEFVIWPEYTVPLYPMQDRTVLEQFREFAQNEVPFFAGFTDLQGHQAFTNSIFLFGPGWIDQYDKVHLTPFGEYVLFRKLLFFVKKVTDEIGDFTPGKVIRNLTLNGHRHATPICYEIIYPELVREFVAKGGEAIITISNDSWFGPTWAPYQHLCMARFRAIENRRYILRSTSNGISALIDPTGRVVHRSPLAEEDSIVAEFRYSSRRTLFTRLGYRFPYLCLAFLALFLVGRSRAAFRKKPSGRRAPRIFPGSLS